MPPAPPSTRSPKPAEPGPASGGGSAGSNSGGFVHLHLHTEYSLLDGGNQVEKLVDRIAELGMTAVAVTDHGNIFGAVQMYEACKAKGIKPILGVEAYVTPPGKPRSDRTYTGGGEGGFHLVLLATNNTGWRNMLVLCSEAYVTGFYYKPRIDRELLAKHNEGLVAINGHLGSEIGEHLLSYHRSGDEKHWKAAVESAQWHKQAFSGGTTALPARFFIELQHHVPEQNAINPLLIRLARELDIPLVCDNDAHFLREEDYDTHDTLICISTAKGKRDENRMRYPREVFVKSPAQMQDLFAGDEYNNDRFGNAGLEALANTVKIAAACDVTLPLGANHAPLVRVRRRGVDPSAAQPKSVNPWTNLPSHDEPRFAGDLTAWYQAYCAEFEVVPFRVPLGASEEERKALLAEAKSECDAALRLLAEGGFVWRYGPTDAASFKGVTLTPEERTARLERELKILADKNISAYFLVVWDFVNWGRTNGVPALARGSGVGTMVGYVLGLSNACPVRYGLLFERFTDPDRSEYPDIDIDLCQDGRARVIDYVRTKYGHVAQIITFGTLKARAALRDVGRVLELPIPEVDRVCKMVPEALDMTLEKALEQEPDLRKLRDSDDRFAELLAQAQGLEGHTRHAGVHAAGVIVATVPLQEIVPLYKQPGSADNEIITQWDGPTCEKMGLLKMDFLGLRTISVVERAKKLIRETLSEQQIWEAVGRGEEFAKARVSSLDSAKRTTPGSAVPSHGHFVASPLDLDRLSYDDPKVFELFRRGETTGVFQFESGGMRRLLVEMKPDRLEDLIAANALFRPGPMDLIPDYNRRKHGTEEVPRVHEIVDRYTSETYGVMVYQEQVMQIVHGLGGIKLRDAYSLIKNISKKKHDKIEKERPKFIEGAVKKGLTDKGANELFELILKFAGYGFNKSHSTGYAIVAYQTAYLKTYFPNQYMAAFLTYESQASKVSEWIPYLEDCRRTRFVDPATGRTVKAGVEVKPPDINLSKADFTVVMEDVGAAAGATTSRTPAPSLASHCGHVRFGLKAIKGAGEKAIETIIIERDKRGPFTSLYDFCERVPTGVVNKSMFESLIKCGAFDGVHSRDNRAAMVASIDQALSAGSRLAQDRAAGQGGLFMEPAAARATGSNGSASRSAPSAGNTPTPLARISAWSESETLAKEKEVLGFYLSSHPLDRWKFWSSVFATSHTQTIKEQPQDARVVIAAMVQSARTVLVKSGRSAGQKMAILTVEDMNGACECVMFTDCYAKYGHLAAAEAVVFVLGRIDLSRGDPQIIVDRLVPVDGVPLESGRLRLFLDATKVNGDGPRVVSRVADLLKSGHPDAANGAPHASGTNKGPTKPATSITTDGAPSLFPIDLVIATEDQVALIAADPKIRVALKPELVQSLQAELGIGMLRVVGGLTFDKEKEKKPWQKRRGSDDGD